MPQREQHSAHPVLDVDVGRHFLKVGIVLRCGVTGSANALVCNPQIRVQLHMVRVQAAQPVQHGNGPIELTGGIVGHAKVVECVDEAGVVGKARYVVRHGGLVVTQAVVGQSPEQENLGVERAMLVSQQAVDLGPDLLLPSGAGPDLRALATRARGLGLRVEVDVLGRDGQALLDYGRSRGAHHILLALDGGGYRLLEGATERVVQRQALWEEMASWTS